MTVVDSTFATPLVQQPARPRRRPRRALGHQGASPGTTTPPSAWSPAVGELLDWLWGFAVLQGANASPFDAMNGLRGLRTLAGAAAPAVRDAPSGWPRCSRPHERVDEVRYPGLESHPQRDLAKRQMALPGGLLSFDVAGGLEAGRRFVESVRIAQLATSLGGPETLVTHPASTTHVNLTPEELAAERHRPRHHPGVGRPRAPRRRHRRLLAGARARHRAEQSAAGMR